MSIGQELLTDVNDDLDLLKRVLTDDEYSYDIESKAQSSQWRHSESASPEKRAKFDQM